jgi:hypothetical protein
MFSDVRIGVGFQLERHLTFRSMVVKVKPWFMIMSFFAILFQRLVVKSRFCYNTHALLQ